MQRSLDREVWGSNPGCHCHINTVAHAINSMLDHIHVTDRKLAQVAQALQELGVDTRGLEIPDLDPCEISSTAPGEEGTPRGNT